MKGITQDTYGSTDVLEFRDVAEPRVGERDVLVQVKAAGVEIGAWHVMAGKPYLLRLMGFGLRKPKVPVRAATSPASSRPSGRASPLPAGRRGVRHRRRILRGVRVGARGTARAEAGEPHVRAGGGRPDLGRHSAPGLAQGQRSGGAEGVGRRRVRRRGVVRRPTRESVRRQGHRRGEHGEDGLRAVFGADDVIDYTHEDFADGTRQWDLILDMGGLRSLSDLRRALTPKGTLVIVGGEGVGSGSVDSGAASARASCRCSSRSA